MTIRRSYLVPCSRDFLRKTLQLPEFSSVDAFYWDYDSDALVLKVSGGGMPTPHPGLMVPTLEADGHISYQRIDREEDVLDA